MKKKIVTLMLAGMLTLSSGMTVMAEENADIQVQSETTEESAEVLEFAGSKGEYEEQEVSEVALLAESIPDENFRNYLKVFDKDNDGILKKEEVAAIVEINVANMGISSLKGISRFRNLTVLDCSNNKITELELSHLPNLTKFNFGGNPSISVNIDDCYQLKDISVEDETINKISISWCDNLENIHIVNSNIDTLDLRNNKRLSSVEGYKGHIHKLTASNCNDLNKIDIRESGTTEVILATMPSLQYLNMDSCNIQKIDLRDVSELHYLGLPGNGLKEINLTGLPKLDTFVGDNNEIANIIVDENNIIKKISVNHNKLTNFDFTKFKKLQSLDCNQNAIKKMVIPEGTPIQHLDCSKNDMESLDISHVEVAYLDCSGNKLESIDLRTNKELITFLGANNKFTEIDFSKNANLKELYISGNPLNSLNLSKCTSLEKLDCSNCGLKELNIENNWMLKELACDNNQLTSLKLDDRFLRQLSCTGNKISQLIIPNSLRIAYENGQKTVEEKNIVSWYYLYKSQSGVKNEEDEYKLRVDASTRVMCDYFKDVTLGTWQYDAAVFAYEQGYMSGKGKEADKIIFAPNESINRAEFVCVLYNMEKKPDVVFEKAFDDVADGQWYSKAIIWAKKNNIVAGKGNNKFDVQGNISREEMATMLLHYAAYRKYDIFTKVELTNFPDAGKISAWAVDNMKWAVANGIMKGKGQNIDPLGKATRAECAAMIKNFSDRFFK